MKKDWMPERKEIESLLKDFEKFFNDRKHERSGYGCWANGVYELGVIDGIQWILGEGPKPFHGLEQVERPTSD